MASLSTKLCQTKGLNVLRTWDNLREEVKYYFADLIRKGGTPSPFSDKNFAKKKLRIRGVPPLPLCGHLPEIFSSKRAKNGVFYPKNTCFLSKKRLRIRGVPPLPLYGHSAEIFSSKRAKNCVFLPQKNLFFCPKKGYGFGGYPPSLYGKIFGEKAVRIWGVPLPPPFTDKIRKVVFDLLPYEADYFD